MGLGIVQIGGLAARASRASVGRTKRRACLWPTLDCGVRNVGRRPYLRYSRTFSRVTCVNQRPLAIRVGEQESKGSAFSLGRRAHSPADGDNMVYCKALRSCILWFIGEEAPEVFAWSRQGISPGRARSLRKASARPSARH